MRACLYAGQQRMRSCRDRCQPVPAHMRHCQAGGRIKGAAGAADQPQKRRIPLFRAFEQQLHAKTDAQNRLCQTADARDQTRTFQLRHGNGRCANPRKNHLVSRSNHRRVGGQFASYAKTFKRETHRGDIRPATVDNGNHRPLPTTCPWCWAGRRHPGGSPGAARGRTP